MADVIRCDLYDYFEIACMRRELIDLKMLDGERIHGTAIDLQTKEGREWLLLDQIDQQQGTRAEPVKRQLNLREIELLVFPNTGQSIKIADQ